MILKYVKTNTDNYSTVRQVMFQEFNLSYNLSVKLKKDKKILLNGTSTFVDKIINPGDVITANIDFEEDNSNIIATKMDLNILYEDEAMLILDKPAGLPVHPSILHYENSLSNGVKYYFDSINLQKKIRPVNRLDRNTSGIVIFAKNEYVHDLLSKQMQNKTFVKEYIAICEGAFEHKEGTINAPISRKEGSIIERCVSPSGDTAITHYKVLREFYNYNSNSSIDNHNIYSTVNRNINENIHENKGNNILFEHQCFSELLINLETGRTHQIRVHMAYIGHPILGDSLYGNESALIDRQALHAYKVEFIHPISKKNMVIAADIPKDMANIIKEQD